MGNVAKIIVILFLISKVSKANFGEFFGASTSTSSIGAQSNFEFNDGANNYYHPSLIAWGNKASLSVSNYYIHHGFKEINDVRIRNAASSDEVLDGDIATNYEGVWIGTFHAVLPIMRPDGNKLGVSVFTPLDTLSEINSGDPFLTEYVMYRSRYKRTIIYTNFAMPINDWLAASIGLYTGLQTSSDVFTRTSVGNPNFNTYARVKARARPSLAGIASISAKSEDHIFSLTFQQQMKSKLEIGTLGSNSSPSIFFDFGIESLMYYDPYILRFSHAWKKPSFDLVSTLEYQIWDQYETPVIRINQNSQNTINSSQNFETVSVRSIFVPKVGLRMRPSDTFFVDTAVSYKPSPIDGDFSGSGNSVDTDSYIGSFGIGKRFKIMKKDSEVSLSTQYHHLAKKTITKNAGTDEDGNAGEKIGAPGYDIGGFILNTSIGMKVFF